jgi:cytochrome c-type biogenesis protein CcmE
MPTGAKIAVAALLIVGTIAYVAWQGAANTWQYYVTVDECLTQGDSLAGSRLRVSGPIEPGSLAIAPERTEATFSLAGTGGTLRVTYRGALPDNLREQIDVVAEGRLDSQGALCADKLLTRCAGKYAARAEAQTASTQSTPAPSALR